MKRFTWITFVVIITFLTLNVLINTCEARGGRGRGGGSFGGIFGGWRKYKKPSSSSNSRRTISGSPMHTTATKSASSSSSNSVKQTKPQMSYPKQQMPQTPGSPGYNPFGGYHPNSGAGVPPLPPGSTYYPNMGAMPPGAIYYAQPIPMQSSSSGTGNFLMGMLAGHMASNLLFGPRHHVTHIYEQNSDQTSNQNDPKIIVINNGEATVLNTTDQSTSSPTGYWPTDTDTPLEPFNDTVTPADAQQPAHQPISSVPSTPSTSSPDPPVNGIICMPIQLNETNPNDPSKVQQVERVICFPAPPSPPPTATANVNCVIRTFIESDPNDPSKTIEVPREICTTPTTTSEPRQVAGEIGESVAGETDGTSSLEVGKETQEIVTAETATNGKSSENEK